MVCFLYPTPIRRLIQDVSRQYWKFILIAGCNLGKLMRSKQKFEIVFIFPFYHIGGAEKVHSDIVNCFRDKQRLVVFTQKSNNASFLPLFQSKNIKLLDLPRFGVLNCFYWYFLIYLYMGFLVATINKNSVKILFGSNTQFFYKILPYVNKKIKIVDLTHAFGGDIEKISIEYADFIDLRVTISEKTRNDIQNQYKQHAKSRSLGDKIIIICNSVRVSKKYIDKNYSKKIVLLYVGRPSPEKRVYLIGKIARKCHDKNISCRFILIGGVESALNPEDLCFVECIDEIHEFSELEKYYKKSHFIIITSIYEGFPMSIMEAMANGTVPLSTDVGGISEHIRSGENGILIHEDSENDLVDSFVKYIEYYVNNREEIRQMSHNAYCYATQHFSFDSFCQYYQKIFELDSE